MNVKRLIVVLGLAGFIVMADNWVVSPLLPDIAHTLGVQPARAGILIAACMLPFGLFQLLYGPLADRFGKLQLGPQLDPWWSKRGSTMNDGTTATPVEIMPAATPEGVRAHLEHTASMMENPELQALPPKYKLLVGIGVAAALQSSGCTLRRSKLAKQAGRRRRRLPRRSSWRAL